VLKKYIKLRVAQACRVCWGAHSHAQSHALAPLCAERSPNGICPFRCRFFRRDLYACSRLLPLRHRPTRGHVPHSQNRPLSPYRKAIDLVSGPTSNWRSRKRIVGIFIPGQPRELSVKFISSWLLSRKPESRDSLRKLDCGLDFE